MRDGLDPMMARPPKSTPPGRSRASPFGNLYLLHLVAIFALALAVRLLYWQDARLYAVGADEPDYVVPAQQLVREGRYVDTYISRDRIWTRVPLTALFFAGSFLLVPDNLARGAEGDDAALMEPRYDALNIAQIVVSLATVALTMLLAYRAFPHHARRAALLAGYISALYPPLASSPAQRALSEPLSIAVIFAAILLLTYWNPHDSTRKRLAIAALVGLLLGVGALVRSVALAFLPFACLYFLWANRAGRPGQLAASVPRPSLFARPIISCALAIATCFAAIAPWTYFNYTQYGSFLLLETANTTAYWHYHNFRRENEDEVLRQYDDPADRLSVIVSRGTANILQYPDQAIGTTIFSFFYAWHLESNSAVLVNSWDFTQRDPDLPDLLPADLATTLLGLVGLAGLAGVGLRRPSDRAGRTLLAVNLWLLTMLLLGVIVPYDARYRLPAAPGLAVLAAGLLVSARWRDLFKPASAWAALRRHPKVAIATLLLCSWVLIGAYTPHIPPLLRSIYHAWRAGMEPSLDGAGGGYDQAQQAFPGFYWAYRAHADDLRARGQDDTARALYAQARTLNPDDPYGILGLADLAARNPNWRLTPEERDWLNRPEEEWRGNPWNSFGPSPAQHVDLGTGRDVPYVLGFHRPDREPGLDYRWSMGRAHLRIPIRESARAITLRMSAPGVGSPEPMPVSLQVDGARTVLSVPAGWADYTLPLPRDYVPGDTLHITLESPIRDLALINPTSFDKRKLGVGLDRVTLLVESP